MADDYTTAYEATYGSVTNLVTAPVMLTTMTVITDHDDPFARWEGKNDYDVVSARMTMILDRPAVEDADDAVAGNLTTTSEFTMLLDSPIVTTPPPTRRVIRRPKRIVRRNL